MAMSKKDYELIADAIAFFGTKTLTHREKALVCRMATGLANRIKGQRPEFDIYKFMQACKLPKVEGFNC